MATITELDTNQLHQFFVIARNKDGNSLPSSIIHLNVSSVAWNGQDVKGVPSCPHQIAISRKGTDFITLSWTSPAVSTPDAEIKYR